MKTVKTFESAYNIVIVEDVKTDRTLITAIDRIQVQYSRRRGTLLSSRR
jgi:hypothetical protein